MPACTAAVPRAESLIYGPLPQTLPVVVPVTVRTPGTAGDPPQEAATLAEQDAVDPPPLPIQLQFHGPDPETLLAVPELHRFVVGALESV